MLKFLFVEDSHAKVRGPSSRTDNYGETVLRKFAELGEVAKKERVTAIFHAGDLFDGPRIADGFKGDLGRLIRSWGIPMYVVPGNHDLFGYSLASLDNTSLGLFIKHGIVYPLTRATGPVKFTDGKVTISFTGQEYHVDLDRRDPALDYYVDEDFFTDYRVLIVHGMLLPKPFHPDQAYTLIDDVPVNTPTSPDLIICGHYHPGWPTEVRGGTTFVNIGSMLRTDAGWDNMNRMPQYGLIEVDHKHGLRVIVRQFQSAERPEIVLDRSARDAANLRAQTLQTFRQNIDQKANLQAMDVVSIMDNIATSEALDVEVRQQALERIEAAEQLVEDASQKLDGFIEKPGPYYITRVEAVNFQSWKHLDVTLDPHLNVIIGASDKGKSAILRAIRWCLYNLPRGADFARWGAKKQTDTYIVNGQPTKVEYTVKVTLTFSDGTRLTRGRTNDSSGYYVIETPGQDPVIFKGFAHNPPPDILNATQMPMIPLSKGVEKSLNFQTQHEGAFMLSDDPGTRAAAIGRLTGVQVVDAAIRDVAKDITNAQREMKSKERERERLANELQKFADLEQEERLIQAAEVALYEAGKLDEAISFLTSAEADLKQVAQERAQVEVDLQIFERRLQAEPALREAEQIMDDLADLQEAIDTLARARTQQAEMERAISAAETAARAEVMLREAQQLQEEIADLRELSDKLGQIQAERTRCQGALQRGIQGVKAENVLRTAGQILDELVELDSLTQELNILRKRMANGRTVIEARDRALRERLEEYAQALREAGTCPTCATPVSSDVLESIVAHHLHEERSA